MPIGTLLVGQWSGFLFLFRLVFELGEDAFVLLKVLPWAQIHGLVKGITLGKGMQIPRLDYRTHCRHVAVGWNGDVAARNPALTIQQAQFNAPLVIDFGDHGRTFGVELVLELVAAAVGSTGGIRGIQALEHHAFPSFGLQMTKPALFVGGIGCCFHELDMQDVRPIEQAGELNEPLLIRLGSIILPIPFQQIEGIQHVAHTFPVQDEVAGDFVGANDNG